MKRETIALGFLALILFGAILSPGCARERRREGPNPVPPALTTPALPGRPTITAAVPGSATCSAEGGSVCSAGTDCPGRWLDASDTFSCCSSSCTSPGGVATVTIEPYGTEVTNGDLGSIT
ncbi:MAG TPA: hypothetical protein VMS81_00950 [Methanomicrobiales archaeon]|jgi:hypothetical protein|nr:hypothetical protein [Methanomicrobiales archaeon]